ncbi:hypothetical protein PLANTIT3_50110 [Plantibacter sp. T3]|nr:hypothetical protein PLANTIT3_50110 [Plantibacter sp. T3]
MSVNYSDRWDFFVDRYLKISCSTNPSSTPIGSPGSQLETRRNDIPTQTITEAETIKMSRKICFFCQPISVHPDFRHYYKIHLRGHFRLSPQVTFSQPLNLLDHSTPAPKIGDLARKIAIS